MSTVKPRHTSLLTSQFRLERAQWDTGDRAAAMTTKQHRIWLYQQLTQADPAYQPELDAALADYAAYQAQLGSA